MTCIVGLKHRGKVYIGGDSLGSNSALQKTVRADEKVFKKDDMIFGFTSSFRMGQILRYSFHPPARSENIEDMQYLVGTFIPALIKTYSDHGFLSKSHDRNVGGVFLLGYRKELYKIESDFQVGIPVLDYDTCGCGDDLASGCLYATEGREPIFRIEKALEAASLHSAGVAPPYKIVSI
jgi:hypothetical protein